MGLKGFMEEAYGGQGRVRKLATRRGSQVVSVEDLADRLGPRPSRAEVAELAPAEGLLRLIESPPAQKSGAVIWGYLTSLAAEQSASPICVPAGDWAGLEMAGGRLILQPGLRPPSHVGERMKGGRISMLVAGEYLGQEMHGGGIVCSACSGFAFRNMRGGFGVVKGNAADHLGVGNAGGRILVRGSAGARAGWLMRLGRLVILGDCADYLGLRQSGGEILVRGAAGCRAGLQRRGGRLVAGAVGAEAGDVSIRCI